MENRISKIIRDELAREETLARKYRRKLERLIEYRGIGLRRRKRGNRWYYSKNEKGRWKYLGSEDNREVLSIQECYQLERVLKQIEINQKAGVRFLKAYKSLDYDSLKIPNVYRAVNAIGKSANNSANAIRWKTEAERIKARYNLKYPEHLIHTTNDGTRVRSKSEVIIYNLLLELGLVFVYELPMFVNGVTITPDFTVYDEGLDRLVVIEHLGLIGKREYMEFFEKKLLLYDKAGYALGDNLILTSDNLHGDFNSAGIARMLEGIFV